MPISYFIAIRRIFLRTMGWQDTKEYQETAAYDPRHYVDRIRPTSIPHENY